MMTKYSKKQIVEDVMHEMKDGKLKSGSRKKVPLKDEKPEKLKTQGPLAEKDEVKQAEENIRERQKHNK